MKLIKCLIEAISDRQKSKLNKYGLKVVEEYEIGDYQLVLVKGDIYPISPYSMALQRKGMDFTDLNQQMRHIVPDNINLSDCRKIIKKAVEWVNKYGEMVIGSHNPRKTKMYGAILKHYGLGVEKFEIGRISAILVYKK